MGTVGSGGASGGAISGFADAEVCGGGGGWGGACLGETCELNISLGSSLPGCPAAIDQNGIASDEGGCAGGEEDDGSGYVHGLANSVKGGDALEDISAGVGVGQIFLCARSVDECGCDRIHCDVVLSPFDGKAFGEMRNGGLGHAVDGLGGQGNE